jgi:hypothetical protein
VCRPPPSSRQRSLTRTSLLQEYKARTGDHHIHLYVGSSTSAGVSVSSVSHGLTIPLFPPLAGAFIS